MLFAIALTVGFILFVWLIFFQLKWLKWSIAWAIVAFIVLLHVLLIFMIGLRFVTPYSTEAKVIQHTIQLVPRLTEPTLVTAVLVEPDVPVKKGQPLFQFDQRPYEDKVNQLQAELAQAKQNVLVLKADVDVAVQKVDKAKSDLKYSQTMREATVKLAKTGAAPEEESLKWVAQTLVDEAAVSETQAEADRAHLRYESEIGGVNTAVAEVQAELNLARFYLENTTLVAPEDGRIVNLQVRPGMVSGDYRAGAIASFICEEGRYLLVSYTLESLKFVNNGQPVEVALNLYPGQIFRGKVEAIWKANGDGQLLPSGNLPKFEPQPSATPQNCYAVKIVFDGADQSRFPIGAQGAAAIYTAGMKGSWAALRRISIRTYTWFNWLYPLPF
jgi:multidrug resistance efflux pump